MKVVEICASKMNIKLTDKHDTYVLQTLKTYLGENYQTNSKTEVDSYRESFCVFRKLFSLKHQNGER